MLHDSLPRVMISTCVHNKHWVIAHYIRHLEALDYPKDKISLVMYVNDSIDGTKEILLSELLRMKNTYSYGRIEVYEENFGHLDNRQVEVRKGDNATYNGINENFSHFATVRNNHLLFLQNEDYFFSVDSDVLVRPKSLRMLIETDKDFVALPVNNQENRNGYPNAEWPKANYNMAIKTPTGYQIWTNFHWNEIFEVDVTGACVLMKAEIAKEFVYRAHPFGEDAGLCSFLSAYGIGIWVNSNREYEGENVLNVHCMNFLPEAILE